jgi:predicted secreted hydrolase
MTAPAVANPVRPSLARRGMARVGALVAAAAIVAGCTGAPILANPPLLFPSPEATQPIASPQPDPIPISFPRDDGPHDRLTEWWYYTGHLQTDAGRTFGFEAVVFRAERGSVPAAWAAHLALTDEAGSRFYYAQRSEVGPQVDRSPRDGTGTPTGFDLDVSGLSQTLVATGAPVAATPWRLAGAGGTDTIQAALAPEEATASGASFGIDLGLRALKSPVLHQGNGFIDFGPAGSSYYYSRTRLAATGSLQLNGVTYKVTGIAWFDHQWGDFVSVGAGGWDWFAINLDDGTDVTLSIVRDEHAGQVLSYGTLVRPSGEVVDLQTPQDFGVSTAFGAWQSPRTGVDYPTGWSVFLGPDTTPSTIIQLVLTPTVADQELDTRATTGVVYWEGSNTVTGTRGAAPIAGKAYVEITRYDVPGG